MADARIKAVITAEDRASRVVGKFGQNIDRSSSRLSRLGQAAKTAAATLGVALGAAAVSAAKFAISSAANYEQSRIAFDTMLGSADKARKLLQQISDFAIKTPFELEELVEGSKRLLAYSIDAKKLLPTLKALGNIAAGVGREKMPQLILAFGQVKTATKLTGMELRQFTEAGVPLLEELAKVTGKTAAQIKEDMEDGAAPSFAEVEQAIFNMSKNGGKFFNLMDRQSKTLSGTFSNLKDALGRLGRSLVGINEQGDIREGSFMAKLSEAATLLVDILNDGVTPSLGVAGDAFMQAQVAASAYKESQKAVKQSSQAVKVAQDEYNQALANFGPKSEITRKALEKLRIAQIKDAEARASSKFQQELLNRAEAHFIKATPGVVKAIQKRANSFGLVIDQLGTGVKTAKDLDNLLRGIKQEPVGNQILKGIESGSLRVEPRQHGGPITANRPYLVGETGPEIVVPGQSGQVIPNGVGGSPINITIQAQAFMGSRQEGRKFAQIIAENLKDIASSKNMTLNEMLS